MMTRTRRWSTDFERECEVIYQRSCHTANPCDDAYIGILDLQRNEIIPAQINSNYLIIKLLKLCTIKEKWSSIW